MEKLLLIDGNSILNRGFYGVPLLSNSEGVYTNAIVGFLNILFKVMADENPDYIIVAFDVKAPTFRHELFKEYKGTRKPMPEELRMQLPIIREVLSSMKITIVEKAGYEADDILGTFAKRYQKSGYEVTLLSGDRDLLQISDEHIKISIPKTFGGKTETFNYYPKDVLEEYQVTPLQFIDVKALQGDSSDNIPGVTKVGPKTATDLILKYNNLEGVYEHIEEQKGKLKENLINDKDIAFLSRTLATINIDSPVEADINEARCQGFLNDDSLNVLRKYSLKSIITKLESMGTSDTSSSKDLYEVEFETIEDFSEVENFLESLKSLEKASFAANGSEGISISTESKTVYIPVGGFITCDYLSSRIKECVKEISKVITYKIKDSYSFLGKYQKGFEDVEILAYLVDPLKGDYPITYIGEYYLERYTEDIKTLISDPLSYCALSSRNAFDSYEKLYSMVKEMGMEDLYYNIEMPLSFVLYSMETEGIKVNGQALTEYGESLKGSIEELESRIYEAAGEKFNINSPKQLGEILFEKLSLPFGKKTKSGYSTAADVLEKLAPEAPIVKDILEYRTLTKLKSTYADGLYGYIEDDGRIHTHFNQTITATGRISSTEPNLQNIPIRTELGRQLRKVFVPKDGFVFLDADYSQIELRLMAHFSNDEKLIDAYKNNKDIHRSTASKVFHVPFEEVTDLQRRNAKAVNFGIIYGISSYGLSQDLSISVSEAKRYIEDYFEEFPAVKGFMDSCIEDAKACGSAKTLFGRLRPIPELKASNFMQRSFGERVAMNAPLQGTAADIMKIAMINIFNRLEAENLESKLLIQVHDEVLVETKESEKEKVMDIIKTEMVNAANLLVNLEVDAHFGNNWYEAK